MKTINKSLFKYSLILIVSAFMLQFTEDENSKIISELGPGIIYMKEDHIIKNIVLREIKSFWIVYEKNKSLHDISMDKISHIVFVYAKPKPVNMTFEENKPVIREVTSTEYLEEK